MTQAREKNVNQQAPAESSNKKKNKKANSFLLILIIIVLTLIIFFGSVFMFNIAGLKKDISKMLVNVPVVGKLVRPVIEDKTPQEIEKEQIEMEKKNLELEKMQLAELKKELDTKEKQLSARENSISNKELLLSEKLMQVNDKLVNVQEQAQYLEKIETSKAVKILLNMENKSSVVQILRSMKREKATALLGAMDPLQAAQILEDLYAPEASVETGAGVSPTVTPASRQ